MQLQADAAPRYAEQVWWTWDLGNQRLSVRSVGECILGYPEGDLEREEAFWWDRIHPADRPEVESTLKDCFDGLTAEWHCDHRMRDVANEWVWVAQSGVVLERDANGHPLEMVGTTRKRQECYQLLDLIRGSEALLDSFLEHSPIPFWLRDAEGMILLCSKAMRDTFGSFEAFPEEASLVGPEAALEWQDLFQAVLHGQQKHQTVSMIDLAGKTLPCRHDLIPVSQGAGPFAILEIFQPQPA